jgi:YfiH family protein
LNAPAPTLLRAAVGAATVVCTGRHGGVSSGPYLSCNVGDHVGDAPEAVEENRRRIAAAAGLPDPATWVWLDQVHGTDVHEVIAGGPTASRRVKPVADAAVTNIVGRPLTVVTADCAPVVIASDDAVGVVHAGHRGLFDGVIERAVATLSTVGTGPLRAFLGPCIRPARYEFGESELARFVDHFGPSVAGRTTEGRPALDIPAAVRVALARAGIGDDRFDDSGICTATSAEHFSYRRDGTTGRQVTVAVLG